MIVDIAPPDFELRCAIVQIKAAEKGLDIDTEIVHLIAGNIDTARKIEGFLIRIFSEAKIKNTQVNEELVRGILGKGVNGDERKANLSSDQIIDAVCAHYNISKRAMMGKARARLIARPRQILMYLIRTELKLPLIEVGQLLGGRDHTTIIHGVDKIAQLASNDIRVREDIMKIKSLL